MANSHKFIWSCTNVVLRSAFVPVAVSFKASFFFRMHQHYFMFSSHWTAQAFVYTAVSIHLHSLNLCFWFNSGLHISLFQVLGLRLLNIQNQTLIETQSSEAKAVCCSQPIQLRVKQPERKFPSSLWVQIKRIQHQTSAAAFNLQLKNMLGLLGICAYEADDRHGPFALI